MTTLNSMSTAPRPMLAWNKPWQNSDLVFPLIASPKINGERVLLVNGHVLSRSGKPIQNRYIQQILGHLSSGLDGEITCGDPTTPMVRRNTRSGISRRAGEPDFTYHVFDRWDRTVPFWSWARIARLRWQNWHGIILVPQHYVPDLTALQALEAETVAAGWEGLILRSPNMPYKHGRCTLKEFQRGVGMLKMKRFQDSEAIVLSTIQRRVNLNPQLRTPLGYAERSSTQAGLVPIAELGALLVRDLETQKAFRIGTGLGWTDIERQALWSMRFDLPGRVLTYRHFNEGTDGLPHQPIFHTWQDPET
jgi:DNA ligase-1